jgi:hypothetical protein
MREADCTHAHGDLDKQPPRFAIYIDITSEASTKCNDIASINMDQNNICGCEHEYSTVQVGEKRLA